MKASLPITDVTMAARSNMSASEQISPFYLCCPDGLSCCCSCVCALGWCGSFLTVREKQHAVLLTWGEYIGTIVNPGLYIVNPIGIESKVVSVARKAIDISQAVCVDSRGNPIQVAALVTMEIIDSKKAIIDINNPAYYVQENAKVVMKDICSKYPYESRDGSPSLKSEQGHLKQMMVAQLQEAVNVAGV